MKREESGVTLIELLITIAIIGFVLVPIMGFYNLFLKQTNRSGIETKVKLIAQEEMEKIISLNYRDKLLNVFGSPSGSNAYIERDDCLVKVSVVFIDPETGEIPEYYPVNDNEDTHLKRVIISVSPVNRSSRQINLVYYKSP